ncbi:thermonuclease family protein [Aeromicrobium panaciterrae]|uniref:thermonuclease family protein n=1 Tax=Aeromicrobium panaciterrae TaxID=363861 RepID=UPI00286AF4DE|nr:thermonuclease family protein [Aeromicrobium panaciterrae]
MDLTDSESTAASPKADLTSEPSTPVLLFITDQKDGDSWVASDDDEYRLGMVNAPEVGEDCFSEAAAFTREFVKDGFTVDDYSTDTYGRHVAEVFDKSGDSLNVAFATSGLGDDRYLAEFRHENVALAERLDAAYASAPAPSCKASNKPVPLVKKPAKTTNSNCMDGYSPCLPIRSDMNCPEIGHPVTVTGSDPYRLDRDGDGTGCD